MKIQKLLIIIFIFLSCIKCKEEDISFLVENITLSQVSCLPNLGTYLFYIKGQFSQPPKITNIISFNLESPHNSKTTCYPLEKTSVSDDQLQCEINICDYPINKENITLPINPPTISGYTFPNWKELIGADPGISNIIPEYNIKCTPQEINSYKILSIKSEGCTNNKNIILIDGKWYNDSQLTPGQFKIKTSNNNIANCNYIISQKKIKCEIDGYGVIKFDEKYFKSGINIYKIEKSDYSINVDQCNFSFFLDFNKILLFLLAFIIF
jgi:hypothetical protein